LLVIKFSLVKVDDYSDFRSPCGRMIFDVELKFRLRIQGVDLHPRQRNRYRVPRIDSFVCQEVPTLITQVINEALKSQIVLIFFLAKTPQPIPPITSELTSLIHQIRKRCTRLCLLNEAKK
jgi:hypothetical protein